MAKSPTDLCKVCGAVRKDHDETHQHLFSEDGQLVPKKKAAPRSQVGQTTAELGYPAVVRLTLLLKQKGFLNDQEVAFVAVAMDMKPEELKND